jgi:hypothetical protein
MGLFSTKKKTTVNTTVSRLIEDDRAISSIPTSIIRSIYQNDNQIVENVLEGLISSVGVRANRMYDYAKSNYAYGLPSSQLLIDGKDALLVENIVQGQVGAAATVEYYKFAPLNILHTAWEKLVTDYSYLSSSNTLEVVPGEVVYLQDMQVVITQATFDNLGVMGFEQWGVPANAGQTPVRLATSPTIAIPTPYKVDPNATEDSVLVTYVWVELEPAVVDGVTINKEVAYTGTFTIPFVEIPDEEEVDYFQIRYLLNGNAGFFTYKEGSGLIPELDDIFHTDTSEFGSFFPFTYFRYNKTSMAADTTSAGYLTSKKMVSYLGIDYADMIENINSNPDIADVEQAMLMFCVPANTDNELEQRYLFDFFSNVALEQESLGMPGVTTLEIQEGYNNTLLSFIKQQDAPPKINMVIQDSRFKMTVRMDGITRTRRVGNTNPEGTYSSGFTTESIIYEVQQWDSEFGEYYTTTETRSIPVHYYRKQLSTTVYEEIRVYDLETVYHIWGSYTTIGDDTDQILLIPVDYSITDDYSIPDREVLFARALHFIFNSRVVTKIKWYQQGVFKVFLIIIAVVVMIFTYGATWQATVATLAAMSTTALASAILTYILQYIVISYLVRLFVKLVGVEIAFLVAIIAAVAGAYLAIDAGSIAGAPWAQDLLSIASNLTDGIGDAIQGLYADLQGQYADFAVWVEDQTKLLDKANELLETSSILSPFVIFGESPDDFYNRTVHSGNIGIAGIDAISSYVDIALTLPKLPDTIGDA